MRRVTALSLAMLLLVPRAGLAGSDPEIPTHLVAAEARARAALTAEERGRLPSLVARIDSRSTAAQVEAFAANESAAMLFVLMFALLKENQEDKRDAKIQAKSAAAAKLAEKLAEANWKIAELEAARKDAETRLNTLAILGAFSTSNVRKIVSPTPTPKPGGRKPV